MVGWHRQVSGREFEQALGDGEGQGSLACCSPWGLKESDTTEQLNNNRVFDPESSQPLPGVSQVQGGERTDLSQVTVKCPCPLMIALGDLREKQITHGRRNSIFQSKALGRGEKLWDGMRTCLEHRPWGQEAWVNARSRYL